MERQSARDSGNLRLCTLEKMTFKRAPEKLLWDIRSLSCSWILPKSLAECFSVSTSPQISCQHQWALRCSLREELALSHGSARHECHVLVSNPNLFHISAFFLIYNKTSKTQFYWPLCISVFLFHQKKAFDDILTNKAPELLKDLDTFLGDKKWLVGNSVSIIFVSPISIRLPENSSNRLLLNCFMSGHEGTLPTLWALYSYQYATGHSTAKWKLFSHNIRKVRQTRTRIYIF